LNSKIPKVRISILNWNAAKATLQCIDAVEKIIEGANVNVKLRVIDNGSEEADFCLLEERLTPEQLTRLERNQGFAGGHNSVIQEALDASDDYIWILNNDAIVTHNALNEMISIMESDPRCAAVSPVLIEEQQEGSDRIDFLGSYHDWPTLQSIRLKDEKLTRTAEQDRPQDMWVAGTAPLYRVSSLAHVGGFDQNYFAYFEDNDLGVRLSAAGWTSRMAYQAKVLHGAHQDMFRDRPPYYFYLMTRNAFLFWLKNCAIWQRPSRVLRLLARSLWMARELTESGFLAKRDAYLQGLLDGLKMQGGEPNLKKPVPRALKALASHFPYRGYALFDRKKDSLQ